MDDISKMSDCGEDENYTFVRETVRKRTSPLVKWLLLFTRFLAAGAVFGLGIIAVFGLLGKNLLFNGSEEIIPVVTESETTGFEPETGTTLQEEETEEENTTDIADSVKLSVLDICAIYDIETEETQTGESGEEKDSTSLSVQTKYATGLIWKKDRELYLLTSYNGIKGSDGLRVIFEDGQNFTAKLVGANENYDLAVIKVSSEAAENPCFSELRAAQIGDISEVNVGDEVIYTGNPYNMERLLYTGALAGVDRHTGKFDLSYSTAVTGLSGGDIADGFIFDNQGRVLAMAVDDIDEVVYENNLSGLCLGDVEALINSLAEGTKNNVLGVRGDAVTDDMRLWTNEDMPDGLYVTEVRRDSPAYGSGIMAGDIIIFMGNTKVGDLKDVQNFLEKAVGGSTVNVTLKRKIGDGYIRMVVQVQLSLE